MAFGQWLQEKYGVNIGPVNAPAPNPAQASLLHAVLTTPDKVQSLFQAVQQTKATGIPAGQPGNMIPIQTPPSQIVTANPGQVPDGQVAPYAGTSPATIAASGQAFSKAVNQAVITREQAETAIKAGLAKGLIDRINQQQAPGRSMPTAPITTVSDNGGGFLNSVTGAVGSVAGSLGGQLVDAIKPPSDVINTVKAIPGAISDVNSAINTYGSGPALIQDVKDIPGAIKETPGAVVDAYGHLPGFAKDSLASMADVSPPGIIYNVATKGPVGAAKKTVGDIVSAPIDAGKAFIYGTPGTIIKATQVANTLPVIGQVMSYFSYPFKENTNGLGNVMYLQSQGKPIDGFWNHVWEQNENWKSDIAPWATDPKNQQAIADAYTKGLDTNGDGKIDIPAGGGAVFALFFSQEHPADSNIWGFMNTMIDSMGYDPLTIMPVLGGVTKALETGAEGIDATNAAKTAAIASAEDTSGVTDAANVASATEATGPVVNVSATGVPIKPQAGHFTVVDGKAIPAIREVPPFSETGNLAEYGQQTREVLRQNAAAKAAADAYNGEVANVKTAAATENTANIASSPLNATAPTTVDIAEYSPSLPMQVKTAINNALNSPQMADAMNLAAKVTGTPEAINNAIMGFIPGTMRWAWDQLPEDAKLSITNSKLMYPFQLTKNAQGEIKVEEVHTGATAYAKAAEETSAAQTTKPVTAIGSGSLGSTTLTNEDLGLPPKPPAAPPPTSSVPPELAATKTDPLSDVNLSPETSATTEAGGTVANGFDVTDPRDGHTYTFTSARDANEMADSLSRDTGTKVTVETAQTKATAAEADAAAAAAKAKADAVPARPAMENGKRVIVVGDNPDTLIKIRVSTDGVYSLEEKKPNGRYGPATNVPVYDLKDEAAARSAAQQAYLDRVSGTSPTTVTPTQTELPTTLTPKTSPKTEAATTPTTTPEAVPEASSAGNKVTPVPGARGVYAVDTPEGQYAIEQTKTGVTVSTPDGKTDPTLSAPTVNDALDKIDLATKKAPEAPVAAPYTPPSSLTEARTFPTEADNPLRTPERLAGLANGTVNPFEPVAGGPRIVDRAAELKNSTNPADQAAAANFETANASKRAQAFARDRALQDQIDAAKQARTDAEKLPSGPERDAAFTRVTNLQNDQKINGIQHAIDTAGDYSTHIGGPLPDLHIEAARGEVPSGTGRLVSGERTQAGNRILANEKLDANGNRRYTIVGGDKQEAVITKQSPSRFTVSVNGADVGTAKSEIAATQLADKNIPAQKAGFHKETTGYLMERYVYQNDAGARRVLGKTLTQEQMAKLNQAKDDLGLAKSGGGPDNTTPGGVLGIIDPSSARIINEGVLKPDSNLSRGWHLLTDSKTGRKAIDPFVAAGVDEHGVPNIISKNPNSPYAKQFWALEDGPRALVSMGKLSMPDAEAVSRVVTTRGGETTTLAAMYDEARVNGASSQDALNDVLATYADNVKAGLVNKDFTGMTAAEQGKILTKMKDTGRLTADDMTKLKQRIVKAVRAWDAGQAMVRENIQYNMITGMRGAIQDTLFDTFTSMISGHGGAYALSPTDLALLKRSIMETDPALMNDMRAAGVLKEADIAIPAEYTNLNRVQHMDEFAGRTETEAFAPQMKMEALASNFIGDTAAKIVTRPFASKFIKTMRNTLDSTKKIALFIDSYKQLLPDAQNAFYRMIEDRAAQTGKNAEEMKAAILDTAKKNSEDAGREWAGNFSPSDVLDATKDTSLSRAWQHEQTGLLKGAKAEADRLLFTYRKTNLDSMLSHNVFFHYWATRSMVLHADIALHNPFLMSTYLRMFDRVKSDAKAEGLPASLAGYLHFMGNTTSGMYGVFNPIAFLVPTQMFQNSGNKNDPWWKRAGIFVTPWTEGAMAVFGMTSDIPNLTGTLSVENAVRHVVDYMNANGIPIVHPNGMTMPWTNGEQVTPDFVQALTSQLLKGANGVVQKVTGGMVPDYAPYNPVSNSVVQIRSLIHKYAEDQYGPEFNPDGSIRWTPAQVTAVSDADNRAGFGDINHMEANPLSDKAYKTWSKGEAVGVLENLAVPVSIRSGPLDTMSTLSKKPVAPGTAPPTGQENAKDTLSLIYTGSPAAYDLNVAGNYLANAGTPDTQMYYSMYNDIVFGTNPAAELAPSDQRTGPAAAALNAKIAAMSQDQRKALATTWLQNTYGPQALVALDQQYTARDKVKADNPILQDYSTWASGIGNMDENQFNAYVKGNPNYGRYINGLPDATKTDPAKYDTAKTDHIAYDNAMGNQASAYDQPPISVKDQSKVPLMPGDVTGAGTGTGAAPKLSTTDQLSKDIANYTTNQASYNAAAGMVAGVGHPIDVSQMNPIAQNALVAKLRQLGISQPSMSTLLSNYVQWANVQTSLGKTPTPADYAAFLDKMQSQLTGTAMDPNLVMTGALSGQTPTATVTP